MEERCCAAEEKLWDERRSVMDVDLEPKGRDFDGFEA